MGSGRPPWAAGEFIILGYNIIDYAKAFDRITRVILSRGGGALPRWEKIVGDSMSTVRYDIILPWAHLYRKCSRSLLFYIRCHTADICKMSLFNTLELLQIFRMCPIMLLKDLLNGACLKSGPESYKSIQ